MAFELRQYQKDSLEAVAAARAAGLTRLLVKKPTGTGKTVTFAAMPTWPNLVPGAKCKMLVIAHREELLTQAAQKIRATNPALRVDIEQAELVASRFADVVIASIQTLAAAKFRRLQRLIQQHGTFNLVVVDEAHHAAARTYRGALAWLGFLPMIETDDGETEAATWDDVKEMETALAAWEPNAPKDRLLVGVTATPNRSDAVGLNCVFQSLAYSYALRQAIEDRWLVPITPWVIETRSNLDDVRVNRGEFVQSDLAKAVNTSVRNELALAAWREHAAGLSTIAFSVDVAHAHAIAQTFQSAGITAEAISGDTDKVLRRQYLEAYTRGEITVLANCQVLTEGTDLPRTGCILHCKPTKSATLYEQMTGRGLRIHPGKTECVVIDLVDIARKHSLQAAPVLYGLPPNLIPNGKSLDEFADLVEQFAQLNPMINLEQAGRLTLAQLNAYATKVNIWQIPSMDSYNVGLTWSKLADDSFRLQYPWQIGAIQGTETIAVTRNLLERFDATLTWRAHQMGAHPTQPETVVLGLPTAQEALTAAEAWIRSRRPSVVRLKDARAPWKARPASDKQLAILKKRRIPYKPGLTMGEASDLLDRHSALRSAGVVA